MSPEYLRGAGNGYRTSGILRQQLQERPNMNLSSGLYQYVPKCYRCGQKGHAICAYRWTSGACLKCGSKEDILRDCLNAVVNCFKCTEAGDMEAGCVKENMVPSSGDCGEGGHFMLACPKERIVCGKCGVSGNRTQVCKVRENGSE